MFSSLPLVGGDLLRLWWVQGFWVFLMVDLFRREIVNSNVDRREFVRLTLRLVDVMAELCLLTLEMLEERKGEPLSMGEAEAAVGFDLQFRVQQMSDPGLMEVVRERAVMGYIEGRKLREEWI